MRPVITPFTGFLPAPEFAGRIVGPPRSMLSAEQISAAKSDPLSFRHAVGRSAKAKSASVQEWLARGVEQGALTPVGPAIFVYRQTNADFRATGILAEVSVAAYDRDEIKKHEATIAKTEDRMARYMRTSRIAGNAVVLAYRNHAGLHQAIATEARRPPDYEYDSADGSTHSIWTIDGDSAEALCARFTEVLYIVDGHHRLAAASQVAAEDERTDRTIPAGLFAAGELALRSYARCVDDPAIDAAEVVDRLESSFRLEPVEGDDPRPTRRHEFGVTVGDRHMLMTLDPAQLPDHLADALDVDLLQELILDPLFGITEPRHDPRLRFVADTPHERDNGETAQARFLPYPVTVDDMMTTADRGQAMPPKSTWFAPKLAGGLMMRPVEP